MDHARLDTDSHTAFDVTPDPYTRSCRHVTLLLIEHRSHGTYG